MAGSIQSEFSLQILMAGGALISDLFAGPRDGREECGVMLAGVPFEVVMVRPMELSTRKL